MPLAQITRHAGWRPAAPRHARTACAGTTSRASRRPSDEIGRGLDAGVERDAGQVALVARSCAIVGQIAGRAPTA